MQNGSDVEQIAEPIKTPHPMLTRRSSLAVGAAFVATAYANHAAKSINGKILWANLHFLFWLSLVPFSTGLIGENHFAPVPMAVYPFNLTMEGIAYVILQSSLVGHHGRESDFAKALGRDTKGKISLVLCVSAVLLAFLNQWVSLALLSAVSLIWFIPDRRFGA